MINFVVICYTEKKTKTITTPNALDCSFSYLIPIHLFSAIFIMKLYM